MSLSKRTMHVLTVALADKRAAKEIADHINELILDMKALTAKMDLDPDLGAADWSDITSDPIDGQ